MKLICVLALALCVVCVLGQLPSQDILALLEFKKGIKHDPTGYVVGSWNDESIDFNGCPSSWNGIMCNGGNIAAVVLENLGLVADADLSLFSNLTKLVKLSLTNNSVSGKLPNNIGDFKTLEYLDLSNNLFSSTLPPGIGRLGSLKNLSLSGNNFSGSLPDTISGLKSIQSLDLSGNSFSGPLPLSFLKLDNLLVLNLSNNEFTENIPKGFELMANLVVLDLHKNNLNGKLDPEFLLLTAATHIDFSGNQLANSRSQPQKFIAGISETVKYLNLSYNQLTGSFVGEAQVFENLKVLDLSNNQLSGELPGFSFVYELEVLKLSNNMFSGYIPDNLLKGDALVLTELDLSGNNLTGPISMITSTTLRKLNLSSNSLSGEIPLVTGSCTVIDLSRNQFEGNLKRLLKWANIEILDLSGNRFTGNFPEVTAQFLRLNYLNISHNTLNGPLPKVITHFPKLGVLDLSSNNLSGPLLATLLTMPTIQELHLQGNLLSGTIDFLPPPYNDSNLRVLDLSNNQLSGDFPEGFGSLFAIQDLDISGNRFTGSVPVSFGDINSLGSLDISKNQFTGSLPENLPDSLETFNASLNDLSGVVPENLRKFPVSSFFPGNSKLQFPNAPDGSNLVLSENRGKKRTIIRVVIIIACVLVLIILILLCVFVCYKRKSKKPLLSVTTKDVRQQPPKTRSATLTGGGNTSGLMVSATDIKTSMKKETSTDTITSDEKLAAITGFSPSKNSHFSWSPESGDSYNTDNNNNIARLDVKSPDPLAGELYFLDDTISFTPEELSKAPAEVLGRSSHGTSYRATLDNGLFLTVKWLREGVAKQRKDFAKEAKKFANIRHPNVVTLRGYYWGSTQHEKLILSDYIAPGSLASFLYDRPGRKERPLVWAQRLKISVDVARGLNYLHFDRVVPHGNLKATNILLDGQDLNARVTDYCLHRLITQTGTIEQILDAGVLGYRAPELASSRKPLPSFKSDVYAFGVVLLELLTGKCAGDVVSSEDGGVDLTEWVRLRVTEGRGSDCYDAMLVPELMIPAAEKGMNEVLGIALRCIRPVSERPGIKTIYEDLSSI